MVTEKEIRQKWYDKVEGCILCELNILKRHDQKRQDEAECNALQAKLAPLLIATDNRTISEEQKQERTRLAAKRDTVQKRMTRFIPEIEALGDKLSRAKEALAQ